LEGEKMIKDLEKNDVDISKLFSWSKEVKIYSNITEEPIKVHMRLVGDAEINRARVFALRKSAELRKKLKDEDSDEYFAYISDIDLLGDERLISYLLLENSRDLYQRVSKSVEVKKPKEPNSEATLEEQEKYQLEIDEYPKKVHETITKKMEKELKNIEENLRLKDKQELYNMYRKEVINSACEMEMYSMFKAMCVYFGTFSDKELKERFFTSFEQFQNLPTEVVNQFITGYDSLEIGMDTLKK